MAHWLVKSEPTKYSFADLERDGRTVWDGVRNNAAALHLKAMKTGDELFVYHSQEGLAVVGVAKVVRDRIMDALAQSYPGFGWDHNRGYSTPDHKDALNRLGVTPHHRRTFASVRIALGEQIESTDRQLNLLIPQEDWPPGA